MEQWRKDLYRNELYHYGVKGMKWRHHKARTKLGKNVQRFAKEQKELKNARETIYDTSKGINKYAEKRDGYSVLKVGELKSKNKKFARLVDEHDKAIETRDRIVTTRQKRRQTAKKNVKNKFKRTISRLRKAS